MALTLTIGGASFISKYKTGSAKITQTLQHQADVLKMTIVCKASDTRPTQGKEIVFKDGSRFLFGGFITKATIVETNKNDLFVYSIEATDYSYILINKNAQKTYTSKSLSYIVNDLISTYVPGAYGLTTTNVDTGPTINTIAFNHISLRKAFEKLSNTTGYEWWVDYAKDIHFKAPDSSIAPESITDSSNNHTDINIVYDFTQVRNSITVIAGKEETSSYFVQNIKGDGTAREFPLREQPTTVSAINLNNVVKTYGEDPVDDETGFYFMYKKAEKYVRVVTGNPIPSTSDEIEVSYKYNVPIIVKVRSASSAAAIAALEGGDGIHDYTITDPSIKSKSEARQRALKELDQYANPIISGTFNTRTALLTAPGYFTPGQNVVLNLPQWGITVDTQYLIQQVDISMYEDGSRVEYEYKVRFGGRLLNASTFLQSIAGTEDVVQSSEEVDRIEVIAEDVNITETITRDGNKRTLAESVTISESISKTNLTPPFKWGVNGTANKGVWNKSEWA